MGWQDSRSASAFPTVVSMTGRAALDAGVPARLGLRKRAAKQLALTRKRAAKRAET